jgi:hypothetical protein
VGSNPTRATQHLRKVGNPQERIPDRAERKPLPGAVFQHCPVDGRGKEVTEQGLVQSAGPNVQLASTSLQGQPVRRWRRGHALAGVLMGNSWLRRPRLGDVSASGCGEPIPPSTSLVRTLSIGELSGL